MTERGPSRFAQVRHGLRRVTGIRSRLAITFLCLGGFIFLRLLNPLPAERLRDSAIGTVIEWTAGFPSWEKPAPMPEVLIVDLDEATIARYGRWPLPRGALAQLLDAVKAGKPAAVGFAYVFLPANGDEAGDRRLAASLKDDHVVLGVAQFRSQRDFNAGNIPLASVRLDRASALDALPSFDRLMPPPSLLMPSAKGAGLLSIQLSHDGIPRRLPTLVRYRGGILASLPVEMMRVATGSGFIDVSGNMSGLKKITVGGWSIRTGPNGIVWFGLEAGQRLRRVSALDVLENRVDPAEFQSRYVLIGTTASGLSSEHVSADGGLLPGLDAMAYSLLALLGGDTYYYPAASPFLEMLLALLLAAFAFVTDARFNLRPVVIGGLGAIFMLWIGSIVLVARSGQILDPGLLSLFAGCLYGALILNKYRLAREEARDTIAEKEKEVSTLREDTARVAVAAANPRLSIALSHELRQPLTAARNYLGAIRRLSGPDRDTGNERLASYVDEASRQISSMTEIMNELAEIVRGDLTLMKEDNLETLLVDAASATISSVEGHEIRFIAEIAVKPPPVLLNRRQIQLVVSNLVRNAIEAPRKQPELVLVLAVRIVDDDWVRVSVADNASGIPESRRDRIFSRFESSKEKGSGIGLPFCRDIVEAHGGRLWFESSAGTGTTFFFILRRAA